MLGCEKEARVGLVGEGQAPGVGEEGMLLPLAYVVVVSVIIFLHYHGGGGMSIFVSFVHLLALVWPRMCVAEKRLCAEGYLRGKERVHV